ncbi:CapA family protein [Xylanibacter caecicola]|nr:CapA family protein [Xylanibacter caecicola]
MQNIMIMAILAALNIAACTSAGTDRQLSVPVVVNDSVVADTDTAGVGMENRRDTFVVSLTGDIMMGTTFPEVRLPANGGKDLFRDVRPFLVNADIAVGNLEGTLCDVEDTSKKKTVHSYSFRTPPAYASLLRDAGYDFLSMANNHAFDFGIDGVMSTEKVLEGQGIKYAGLRGRTAMAVVERDSIRFGFCAFGHNGYTFRTQELDGVKAILDSLKECSDIIVVSFHGGAEGKACRRLPYGKETFLNEDRGSLRDFAHFCIDNGADIVYGHGPHVVRCMEVYKDRFIAYSLGNFCTPYGINTTGISGYAPVVSIKVNRSGEFLSGQIHPFVQRYGIGPRRDTTGVVVKEIRTLTGLDIKGGKISISDNGVIEKDKK